MTSTNVPLPASGPDVAVPTDEALSVPGTEVAGPVRPDSVASRDFHHGLYREGVARWRGVLAIV